jgi:hypothetical protein
MRHNCAVKMLHGEVSIISCYIVIRGPGDSVGISTELRAGRSWDRIPVRARFSTPVQTGPGAHRASIQWVPGLSRG